MRAEPANLELVKAKSSLSLEIFANEEKLGELEIGRGSLYWKGRHKQRTMRIDRSEFSDMMDTLAYGD